jgi:hypothetical protein
MANIPANLIDTKAMRPQRIDGILAGWPPAKAH